MSFKYNNSFLYNVNPSVKFDSATNALISAIADAGRGAGEAAHLRLAFMKYMANGGAESLYWEVKRECEGLSSPWKVQAAIRSTFYQEVREDLAEAYPRVLAGFKEPEPGPFVEVGGLGFDRVSLVLASLVVASVGGGGGEESDAYRYFAGALSGLLGWAHGHFVVHSHKNGAPLATGAAVVDLLGGRRAFIEAAKACEDPHFGGGWRVFG